MDERELPVEWQLARIDDLGELRLGKMLDKSKNLGIPVQYLRNLNVRWFRFQLEDVLSLLASPDEIEKLSIVDGDLLVCEGGEPGRCAVWRGGANDFVYQKALHRFRSHGGIVPEILMYMLRHHSETGALSDSFTGTTIKHLTRESLARLSVAVPPLNEQRRIAAKLDTTLAAVDACRQRLDGVAAILKRFRQAVLAAATSGELTREWREEMGGEESIKPVRLGDVIREMRNGLSPKPSLTPPGVRILRIGAIRPGSIDFEDCRYLELSPKDAEQYALLDGDLIFTRYNGTLEFVGVCALVQNVPGGYVYPDKLIRVRCDKGLALPAFVELAFGSANARAQIELLVKSSAGQKGVSGADLKGIRFGLPSIPEQEEIVRRAQQLFTLAEQLEARLTAVRRIVERLTPALLAKAFRGELVPQDPGDEPASVLLERIRAARQAEAASSGPSRRGRKKAASSPDPVALEAAPVPPDYLAALLKECGALSERALLAASELEPARFRAQLTLEQGRGAIRATAEDGGQVVLEAAP
jgi:type I restriction enzyme S subunit